MKRIAIFVLCACMVLLCACGIKLPSLPGRGDRADNGSGGSDQNATVTVETPAPVAATPDPALETARAALRERLSDIRQNVQPGTAGSSLRAAAQAAKLLDWAAGTTLSEAQISEFVSSLLPELNQAETPASLAEQLSSVAYAIDLLTGDDQNLAQSLLTDCGAESSAWPWSAQAVTLARTVTAAGSGGDQVVAPAAPAETGWYQDAAGRWFYSQKGNTVKNDWVQINSKWYYLGADGVMYADRFWESEGKHYYFNPDGTMAANQWVEYSDSLWYYFGADGTQLRSQWLQLGSKWYYLGANGAMLTGSQVIDGKSYRFDSSGMWLASAWLQEGSNWYYFGSDGEMYISKWLNDGGKWYYFDTNGAMLHSTALTIGDKIYAFGENGVCINP